MIARPLLLACVLCLGAESASPHGGHDHDGAATLFPPEHLSPPNVTVVDRLGVTSGFLDRFAESGPLMVSFTYASCTTVCPLTNTVLAAIEPEAEAAGFTLVTVSIDPARDTPAAMAASARDFGAGPRWAWVAASPADTPVLLKAFGVPSGSPEAHVPVILMGSLVDGAFVRILGVPDLDALRDIAGLDARR